MPFYSQPEWNDSAGHRPLKGLEPEQLQLLHRGYIWANLQRTYGDAELARIRGAGESPEEHLEGYTILQSHFSIYRIRMARIRSLSRRRPR